MKKICRKTEAELLDELKRSVDRKRGLTNTAEELGFTIQFISDVIHERRPVSMNLAERMGYKRIVEFEKVP
jgi:hypothetical protein